MVGPDGIEPSTSPLSGVRSSHLSYGPSGLHCRPNTGGAGRDRTGDLLSANQALSQLSYSPFSRLAPLFEERRLRDLIEASWIQGPGISNPQPLSDSLPYALSGDPVACSPSVPRFNPKIQWRFMEWNDCPLLAHAVHSSASGFQKLHPRSLLERR